MHPKEAGLILAVDQASNVAGASLWRNGELIAWRDLTSLSPKDPFGKRLVEQVRQLTQWLDAEIGTEPIKTVLFEGVKSSMVMSTVGAFVCCPHLQGCKFHPRHSFTSALTWKKWLRDRGAEGPFKEIKGVKPLRELGWDFDKYPIESEDVADSVHIYRAWRDKKDKVK